MLAERQAELGCLFLVLLMLLVAKVVLLVEEVKE
jgi:hypothetical protein